MPAVKRASKKAARPVPRPAVEPLDPYAILPPSLWELIGVSASEEDLGRLQKTHPALDNLYDADILPLIRAAGCKAPSRTLFDYATAKGFEINLEDILAHDPFRYAYKRDEFRSLSYDVDDKVSDFQIVDPSGETIHSKLILAAPGIKFFVNAPMKGLPAWIVPNLHPSFLAIVELTLRLEDVDDALINIYHNVQKKKKKEGEEESASQRARFLHSSSRTKGEPRKIKELGDAVGVDVVVELRLDDYEARPSGYFEIEIKQTLEWIVLKKVKIAVELPSDAKLRELIEEANCR